MKFIFSKKPIYFLSTSLLGVCIFIACTNKEIKLVTNIDFEPILSIQEDGFVKDSLPTVVGVVPQVPYPDYYYYASYEVKEGEGFFVNASGNLIAPNEKQWLRRDSTYMQEWNYVGVSSGTHDVIFTFNDNYERRKTMSKSYEINDIPVLWEAVAVNDFRKVRDSIAIDLKLENLQPQLEVAYTYAITMEKGAGSLWDENLEAIEKGKSAEILAGTKQLIFIPAQGGVNTLLFSLTDSNDQKITTSLTLDIEGESNNLPPVANDDEFLVMINSNEAQILDVLANDTDPEMDQIAVEAIVTEPQYGTLVINDDATLTYVPNDNATAESDTFTYTVKDIPTGNISEDEATVIIKLVKKETIAIPDAYFEQYLIDQGFDTDGTVNKMMSKEDAERVEAIDITGNELTSEGVNNFSGIEFFENLATLSFHNHGTVTLDLSKNSKLQSINYTNTQVAFVFANLPDLKIIDGGDVGTMNVDFSTLPSLERINSGLGASLSTYDFSSLTKLKEIRLEGDTFEEPILLNNTPILEKLLLLDLTTTVIPNSLDLSNHMGLLELQVTGTTTFTCIQVSDVIMAMTNTAWSIPESATYALDCSLPEKETIAISDEYFEQYLIDKEYDSDGDLNGMMFKEDALKVKVIDIIGNESTSQVVSDFSGIEHFENLESLKFEYLDVQEIDLSQNKKLERIIYAHTTITSTFKDLPNLKSISAGFAGTMNIDFSTLPALENISTGEGANLSNYNFSNLTKLKNIGLSSDDSIKERFNLNNTPALEKLTLSGAKVDPMHKSLDLKNHPNLITLLITGNDSFDCIQVSDVVAATTNTNWSIPETANYSLDCEMPAVETIIIPDEYFEQYLINEGFDSDGKLNMLMSKDDAKNVKEIEIIGNQLTNIGVKDFTGIEHFENLESLRFEYHEVKEIDLSKNTKLQHIAYAFTPITSTFKDLPNLKSIIGGAYSGVMNIDFLTLPSLEAVSTVAGTNLSTYNFSNLTKLKSIRLSELDTDNTIEELFNLANTPALEIVVVSNAKVGNMYKSLDISNHPNLIEFAIYGTESFDCVQVSDVIAATDNINWVIPDNARYSLDCSQPARETIAIPDKFFEQYLIDKGIDSDGVINKSMYKDDALGVEVLDIEGQDSLGGEGIKDFTGIEHFKNLKSLKFDYHSVQEIDLSQNTKLESIDYSYTNITSVFQNLPNLKSINVGFVSTVNIDFSSLPSLEFVSSALGAGFSNYNFSNLTKLKTIRLDDEDVIDESFNLANTPALEELSFSNTKVGAMYKSLDLSAHPNLLKLKISGTDTFECIQVTDVTTATNNPNWSIPDTTRYAIDCSQPAKETIAIPDEFFEQYLIDKGFDTDGALNGMMYKEDAQKVMAINITGSSGIGKDIDDFAGIEYFENLKTLEFHDHADVLLDLSQNTKLESVIYTYSEINTVFENLPNLKVISAGYLSLVKIDFSTLPSLEEVINETGAKFSNYNFSNLTKLKRIELGGQDAIDDTFSLSNTPALEKLHFNRTKVGEMYKSLDLSAHPNLLELSIKGNDTFDCVQVTDVSAATNNPNWSIPETTRYALDCSQPERETISIPDQFFEQYLIDEKFDTDGIENGLMYKDDALNVKIINIIGTRNGPGVDDFTGIEHFENLTSFTFENHEEVSLDLSKNVKLETISYEFTPVNSTIRDLPNLKSITANYSGLVSMDFSTLPSLEEIRIGLGSRLSNHDFSNLTNLKFIGLNPDDRIEEPFNITNTPSLEKLWLANAKVGAMYKSLDLSSHPNLVELRASGDDSFECFQVSDVMAATNNPDWVIPDTARYSVDCSQPERETISIPDQFFEQYLINEGIDSDGVINKLMYKDDALGVEVLNIDGQDGLGGEGINDFTGIEHFKDLKSLKFDYHSAQEIDLSKNTKLESINYSYTNITSVFQNLPNLKSINVGFVSTVNVDFSSLPSLEFVSSALGAGLSNYNFSNLTKLKTIRLNDGDVIDNSFNLANTPALEKLSFSSTKVGAMYKSLDLSAHPNLIELKISGSDTFECIQVADVTTATNNPNWSIPDTARYAIDCSQPAIETVPISDANFEQFLIDKGHDTDGLINGKMLKSDAMAITDIKIEADLGITNFSGIEFFENLKSVLIRYQGDVALDFSKNKNLESINLLLTGTNFIIKDLPNLKNLSIAVMDNLTLDYGSLPSLEELFLYQVEYVSGYNLSGLVNLRSVRMQEQKLEEELLLPNTHSLETLFLNRVKSSVTNSIDLTNHMDIVDLDVISVENGDVFECIQVADVTTAINNTNWKIPDTSNYSLDCSQP